MIEVKRNSVSLFAHALFGRPYFDPGFLLIQIMGEEQTKIHTRTQESIQRNLSIPVIPIGSGDLSFRIFYELLSFLKLSGTDKILRPYAPKDYSRLETSGMWIWNVFSPETLEKNLKVFFENLPIVYNQIVSTNFPDIKDDLLLFDNVSVEVILFSAKEVAKAFTDQPIIGFFGLSSPDEKKQKIILSKKESAGELANLSLKKFRENIVFDGKNYTMITASEGVLDFIFDDTSMLNFVYDLIKNNLQNHFENLLKSS